MFTKLHLKNFKAWRDTGEIKLAPVNLLLGTNSSGKSSLIQSLLLLKQTAESLDRTIHLNLGGDDNDYFNFGRFDDVLTQDTTGQRQFTIAFDFQRKRKNKGSFKCSYGSTNNGAVVIQELELSSESDRFRAVRRDKGAYSIFLNDETQSKGKARDFAPQRSIALPVEAIKLLDVKGERLEDLSYCILQELEGITYLGPLRRKPERDYTWNKATPGIIESDGNKAIEALFASQFLKDSDKSVLQGVSKWLKAMGIADKLSVQQQGKSTRFEVVVHKKGIRSNLRDVGIGVSQVLPVLTLAYFAPIGSTILLEEPEIHLHPLAQSVLAEIFISISKERNIQFIVETHSEHLFRRMQTLIAKNETSPDDCLMYFVENNGSQAQLNKLDADEFGRIHNWPEKFFGDALGETREQARLIFEKQLKDN